MAQYTTVGERLDGSLTVLYSGTDPVDAVNTGLAAGPEYAETNVWEDGRLIPEATAR